MKLVLVTVLIVLVAGCSGRTIIDHAGTPQDGQRALRGQQRRHRSLRNTDDRKIPQDMISLGAGQRGGAGGGYLVEAVPQRFPPRFTDPPVPTSTPTYSPSVTPPQQDPTQIISDATIWDDTSTEYVLQSYGIEVVEGGSLTLRGTSDRPLRVVFQNPHPDLTTRDGLWGQSIYVNPGGALYIEHVEFVSETSHGLEGMGIQMAISGDWNLTIDHLHCNGLNTCVDIGANSRNVTIRNSVFENSIYALKGSPQNVRDCWDCVYRYKLVNSTIRNCDTGVVGSYWIFEDVTFFGNSIASEVSTGDYLRTDFINNDVAIFKNRSFGVITGSIVDSVFANNRVAVQRACDTNFTKVTFQENAIAMNCSKLVEPYGIEHDSPGIGKMDQVNFKNFVVALQWDSIDDIDLTAQSIYWGSADMTQIGYYIRDGTLDYGAGGVVLYDNSVRWAFPNRVYEE